MITISSLPFAAPWYDEIDGEGCPDQAWRPFTFDGRDFCLYLRWRWRDPWQGHIIRLFNSPIVNGKPRISYDEHWIWSLDLLTSRIAYFTNAESDEAKRYLELFASRYLTKG